LSTSTSVASIGTCDGRTQVQVATFLGQEAADRRPDADGPETLRRSGEVLFDPVPE
jgi:hypothetical protein